MKYIILIAIGILTATFLLSQGLQNVSNPRSFTKYPTYDPSTTPPSIGLPKAFALAQAAIGTATNTFYCVAASCISTTNSNYTGWTFTYANTNGQRGRVVVSFDGQATVMATKGEVYIQR